MNNIKLLKGSPVNYKFIKKIYKNTDNCAIEPVYNKGFCNHIIIEPPSHLVDSELNNTICLTKEIQKLIILYIKDIVFEAYKIAIIKKTSPPTIYNTINILQQYVRHRNNVMKKLIFSMMHNEIFNMVFENTFDTQLSIRCTSGYLLHSMLCYISNLFPNVIIYYSYKHNGQRFKIKIMNNNIIHEGDKWRSIKSYETPVSILRVLHTLRHPDSVC